MLDNVSREPVAHLVEARHVEAFDVLGPVAEFLTPLEEGEPCIVRGTIPPDVSVPLHSHDDPETFFMVSGEVEGLRDSDDGFEWLAMRTGDVFHVPGGARRAPKAMEINRL